MVKYGAGRDFYRRRYAVARPEVCAADIAAVFKECAPYFEFGHRPARGIAGDGSIELAAGRRYRDGGLAGSWRRGNKGSHRRHAKSSKNFVMDTLDPADISIAPPVRSMNGRIQSAAAARILGVSRRSVQGLALRGELPGAARIGRVWTFDAGRLAAFITQRERDAERAAVSGRPPPPAAASDASANERRLRAPNGGAIQSRSAAY